MPTPFTHAIVGLGLAALTGQVHSPLVVGLSMVLATLPDLDVVGFYLGVPYGSFLGHRGFSHSFCCAALFGLAAALASAAFLTTPWWLLWIYFGVVMATHGLLDGCNNGGKGIAYFSPFDTTRYFLPWRPIEVPFIGLGFFRWQAWQVLWSEFRWVWLPLIVLITLRLAWQSMT